jgi:ribonucleoside-triphosphate reductase
MTIKAYIKDETWRVRENASSGYSVGAMNALVSGKEAAHYWLHDVYTTEISEAHKNAEIHIHDLSMVASYCNGWSLRQLITEGITGVPNQVSSRPAKHLNAIINQMVNFLGIMSNESAGAQAFSSVDTYLAPYVKEESLSYSQVKQSIQNLVFGLNTPSRWAGQAPFTNVTFDWVVPSDMKDTACCFGSEVLDYTYSECQTEMDMINKAFLEVMSEGDADGRSFAYPIPTYNVTNDFDWDSDNAELLFEMTGKYGTPYFQNFITSDLDPTAVRSMCCRLQLDKRELQKRGGGLFGANEFTGSIGVVTMNLPNISLKENTPEGFMSELERRMTLAKDSLELKRQELQRLNNVDNKGKSLFPYTKRFLYMGWKNHFSTIGLNGMNEAIQNLFGESESTGTPKGKEFAIKVLEFMRDKIREFQEETGNLYNLEATPAESTSYRLAKHDIKNFGKEVAHQGTLEECYYTNSTQLPVGLTDDIFEAFELQEDIQAAYTGGTVLHGFLGETISAGQVKSLVKKLCENFKVPYISITPTYSVCPSDGYIAGEHFDCPKCGGEAEVYSRIVGYYRPVSRWNKGKHKEYFDRKEFITLVDES